MNLSDEEPWKRQYIDSTLGNSDTEIAEIAEDQPKSTTNSSKQAPKDTKKPATKSKSALKCLNEYEDLDENLAAISAIKLSTTTKKIRQTKKPDTAPIERYVSPFDEEKNEKEKFEKNQKK